ncbi:branched-chain amino acid ABC transporter permease [Marinithermus hydrothermalis]|uniref:ABC-type transporter, integral membrane subunit n=1 Tax=Marinithermus hydrothermalis (strain DSM 14884 / JCM 11576 / T1) TaxID=869210 RepID=F2NPU8_MARHT|nr:branched-chain amino acid ABC transporter permease [Marinithermus hydrothermalis]AEB12874.1 ABC-type transporter, integral membrane subunit [Marinithermus hydrothermalis DSM 14884]
MRLVAAVFALAVLLPVLPLGGWRAFMLDAAQFAFIVTALALSWDLMARTGQLSLAHGAFFGVGAYATAFALHHGLPVPAALALGGMAAAASGVALGALTLRLLGIYFAIATLAFSEIARTLVLKAPVTLLGGPWGYPVPPAFEGAPLGSYFLAVGVLALAVGVSLIMERGRWRYATSATRQGEAVARVLGVPVVRVKLGVLAASSCVAGIAGGVYGLKTLFLTPYDAFGLARAVEALVIPIFGGLYTTAGPLVGGLVLSALENALRLGVGEGYLVVYGAILVLAVLFLPGGIVRLWRRRA